MRAAVILDNPDMENFPDYAKKVFLFEAEGDTVTSAGSHRVIYDEDDYLVVWLKGKHVDNVFMDDATGHATSLLERAGFSVSSLEYLRTNIILRTLIDE